MTLIGQKALRAVGGLLIGVGVAGTAWAGTPAGPISMPLGAPIAPPVGFIGFCTRNPGDCGQFPGLYPQPAPAAYTAPLAPPPAPAMLYPVSLTPSSPTPDTAVAAYAQPQVTPQTPSPFTAQPGEPRLLTWASRGGPAGEAPVAVAAPVLSPPSPTPAGPDPFTASAQSGYAAPAPVAPAPVAVAYAVLTPQAASPRAGWGNANARSGRGGEDWGSLFTAARYAKAVQSAAAAPTAYAAPAYANPAVVVPMGGEMWKTVGRVNAQVNRAIVFRSDEQTWGVEDYWALPLEQGTRFGDCEDYVLEKRHELLAAGVPAQALSIALVTTSWGESHSVLLVATDRGEYVLDNLSGWVSPWTQAGYHWVARQVPGGGAADWVAVADPGGARGGSRFAWSNTASGGD
jgi:predicted transglutaminase-like cysteine proteinase